MNQLTKEATTGSLPPKHNDVIRVCTWNIGGGLIDEGNGTFSSLDLGYFCKILSNADPDILFVQEAHIFSDTRISQAKFISDYINHKFLVEQDISKSHLTEGAKLALAISAKSELFDMKYVQLPNPKLRSMGPDGRPWISFDKGVFIGKINIRGLIIGIANAHLFPFHHFNRCSNDDSFSNINRIFIESIKYICRDGPFIMGADMNMDDPFQTLPYLSKLKLVSSLPKSPTTPTGLLNDYIFVNDMMEVKRSGIFPTKADHYLCWTDIALSCNNEY